MEWVVIIVGVVILIAVVAMISSYFDKKRTAALTQAAMQMGFQYSHDGEPIDIGAKNVMPLFEHGHSKKISPILRGTAAGSDCTIFDYTYTVGYGRSQQTYLQSVAAYRFPVNAPIFQLCP